MLKMLMNNRKYPNEKRMPHFYHIMRSMVKKGLVEIKKQNNTKTKIYRLTEYGWAMACCIAKDFDTEPKYKKHAREVELWIM